ncbi:MAG: monovalent cation/H(+) antiporter subunit G [Spirochaetales bacterium]|nr:monovalent cation/H(+) antiporter subunit G [Spirochaetales bacterium]
MMIWMLREILALIAFSSAVIFGTAGLIGLFRFPDPYSRLQAGSLCGTTAVFSIFIGALLLAPNTAVAARIVIIALFFLISAPTGSHIAARFTWNSGIQHWKPLKSKSKRSDAPDRKGGET